ncbi:MAG: ATPase domain-containing protein, partial [Planctomycetota bacterium]
MSKKGTDYECTECGRRTPQWSGRCPECGEWNSLEELVHEDEETPAPRDPDDVEACTLQQVSWDQRPRMGTGTGEFDRVLGGGLLRGSTVLLGGEPGVGKSSIVLQSLGRMAGDRKCLYLACEESLPQVKLRARRLGVEDSSLVVSGETDLEAICHLLDREDPDVVA